eukprot:14183863-Alexandrium_andersonii.AAC.1
MTADGEVNFTGVGSDVVYGVSNIHGSHGGVANRYDMARYTDTLVLYSPAATAQVDVLSEVEESVGARA